VETSGTAVTNVQQASQDSWGTKVTQFVLTSGTITPSATSAAIQTTGQAETLTGLASGDQVAVVSQPAPTSLCPLVGVRATGANELTMYFTTLTASACTPAAGVFKVLVVR
jgi:hypothetical protein